MSFTMPKQPRTTCPNPKSGEVTVGVFIDDHVITYGAFKTLQLTFTSATVADSTTLKIAGVDLVVDSTAGFYTSTTFAWNVDAATAIQAFVRMIRANFNFNDVWVIVDDATPTTVSLFWRTRGTQPADDFTALAGDLTIDINVPGNDPETEDYFLWYRLYKDGEPVSEIRSASIPFDPDNPFNTVDLELSRSFGQLLETPFPGLENMSGVEYVPEFLDVFTVRVGSVEKLDCVNDYKTAIESFDFKVANSIFQHYEEKEFLNHCYVKGSLAKFLTDRPDCFSACFDSYEWLYIYLEQPAGTGIADVETGAFKVVWTIKDSAGSILTVNEELIVFDPGVEFGVFAIPTGTNHDSVKPFLDNNSATLSVQVEFLTDVDAVQTWLPYSEVYTYNLRGCRCNEVEIWFLNWRGGFDTINFKKIDQFDIEVDATILSSKHILDKFESLDEYFNSGARKGHITRADEIFTLLSDRISNRCGALCWIEQFLTSPLHYIRYQDANGNDKARRVVLDYGTTTILKTGEVFRLRPTFTYLDELNV